jgi:hypothetical protein
VSDAEREHVAGLLQKAVGRGLISLDEFTDRTDVALASRTRGELNSVLLDLPDLRHTSDTPVVDQPLMLHTGSGSVKQQGHWTVPRAIVAECGMGNITIDFTQANCPHHEVTLHATVGSGNITVLVPRGWQVVLIEATSRMGHIANKATDPPDPNLPVLRVHGRVRMGNIKIQHPRGR